MSAHFAGSGSHFELVFQGRPKTEVSVDLSLHLHDPVHRHHVLIQMRHDP